MHAEDHDRDDLHELEGRLRGRRVEPSMVEVEEMRTRIERRVPRSPSRALRRPAGLRGLVTTVLALGALVLGAAGVIAASGQFSSDHKSASDKQYGPPPGCGHHHNGKKQGCKKKCPKKHRHHGHGRHRGRCKVHGTRGNDVIKGSHRPDIIYAGGGNDVIHARGGGRDIIHCGPGNDTVFADRNDIVSKDCEHVHRSRRIVGRHHHHHHR